jgi:hypothetical protein
VLPAVSIATVLRCSSLGCSKEEQRNTVPCGDVVFIFLSDTSLAVHMPLKISDLSVCFVTQQSLQQQQQQQQQQCVMLL